MRVIGVVLGVVVAAIAVVFVRPPITNPALAHELVRMQREEESALSGPPDDQTIVRLHAAHLVRMKTILARYGWPDERKVGPQGSHAAWALVGRNGDVTFHQRALALMGSAAGHVSKRELAYLTDHVAVEAGLPQTYGTVWDCQGGKVVFVPPVKDVAIADRLRREAHMQTLTTDINRSAKFCAAVVDAPPGAGGQPQVRVRLRGP